MRVKSNASHTDASHHNTPHRPGIDRPLHSLKSGRAKYRGGPQGPKSGRGRSPPGAIASAAYALVSRTPIVSPVTRMRKYKHNLHTICICNVHLLVCVFFFLFFTASPCTARYHHGLCSQIRLNVATHHSTIFSSANHMHVHIYINVAYSVYFRFPALSIVGLGLVVGLGSVLV